MMKIALVIPNNLWVSPYVTIYAKLLEASKVDYTIISWDREGKVEEGIQYKKCGNSNSRLETLWSYICFARFVKQTIETYKFDKIIVFSAQLGIFLQPFLEKHYKGKYIFDYRDLSLEQNSIFAKKFKKLLLNSYANVISSPGFKKYLPGEFNYIVSHNFNVALVEKSLFEKAKPCCIKEGISILTIGALRKDMNIEFIDALGNIKDITLSFVGKGHSEEYLKKHVRTNEYKNVSFFGYYKKEDEADIIANNSMINIIYPMIPSHISAMSNRFYNSLIYKRPMIVTKGTIQGDYAQKFGVGLVVDDCQDLDIRIKEYMSQINFEEYVENCNILLKSFLEENSIFEDLVKAFVYNR